MTWDAEGRRLGLSPVVLVVETIRPGCRLWLHPHAARRGTRWVCGVCRTALTTRMRSRRPCAHPTPAWMKIGRWWWIIQVVDGRASLVAEDRRGRYRYPTVSRTLHSLAAEAAQGVRSGFVTLPPHLAEAVARELAFGTLRV